MEYPDSEELFTELARAIGHTNKTEVWKYYPTLTEMGAGTADGVKVWPSVETLKMKPGELWPLYQSAPSHSRSNNLGRSQLRRIQQKMGLIISFPFTKVMVLSIIAFHMQKGLKGRTIMN
jgi:hypothetical protein